MSRTRPFLTARWVNLGLISYDVAPGLLTPLLPPECELDMLDGRAFVSLVAFDFRDTRVLGVRWPGFVNFPEINLRYYVKWRGRRGVCFIRELVPQRTVAWLARTLYHEPYLAIPMCSNLRQTADRISIHHAARLEGRLHMIEIVAAKPAFLPSRDSPEHFFKEHELGLGTTPDRRLIAYRVHHPLWQVYRAPQVRLDWDFGALYGKSWDWLKGVTPFSVVLAAGSEVAVYPRGCRPE